jgi:hypothetical protein
MLDNECLALSGGCCVCATVPLICAPTHNFISNSFLFPCALYHTLNHILCSTPQPQALKQVQQATIVLQGKAAARLSADDAGRSKDKDIKAASFSVLGAKPPPTLVEKQSFAEEVVFLAVFGADIAYTLGCLVGCLEEGGLLKEHSSLFW